MKKNKYIKIEWSDLSCSTFKKSPCNYILKSLYARTFMNKGGSSDFNEIRFKHIEIDYVKGGLYAAIFKVRNGKIEDVFFQENEYENLFKNWIVYQRQKNIELILNDKNN